MVSKSLCYSLLGQNFHLLPEKAVFWEEEKTLILADVHLGKAGHFRKSGIAVPVEVHLQDLVTLEVIVNRWKPAKVLIIGDLFHSDWNAEWLFFTDWLEQFASVQWILVKGNHDILPATAYQLSILQIVPNKWEIYPFVFTHIPAETGNEWYNISGHIHPAVRLTGRGRQNLILPCYYFGSHNGILPAFGKFTGTATIQAQAGDAVFVISPGCVTRVC
jgi:DNA ligase-associated metallophosphoesterase